MNNQLTNQDTSKQQRDSFSELLGQLANNSATVVHDEIELVIQGIREKVKAARTGVITVVIGTGVSFAAFMCLCVVLILGLTAYMAPIMASLVTGVALFLIGAVMVFIGYRKLKKSIYGT